MNWCHSLNRLELNNDYILNDKVGAKAYLKTNVVPNERNRHFLFDMKPAFSEFVRKDDKINRLEQSRAQSPMNTNCSVYDNLGDFVVSHSEIILTQRRKGAEEGTKHD